MDPQIQSMLTSVGMVAATSIAAWAVSKGIVSAGDQSTIANDIVAALGAIVTVALGYLKKRAVSPAAMVATINSAAVPGVKVVAAASPSPAVAVDASSGEVKVLSPSKASG